MHVLKILTNLFYVYILKQSNIENSSICKNVNKKIIMKTIFIFFYFTLRTSEIRITILFFEVGNGVLHVQECNNLLINSHPLLTMPWGPVAGTVWGLEMLYSSIIFLAAGLILILRNQIINSCFKIKIRKSKSKSIQENECTRKNPRCMS